MSIDTKQPIEQAESGNLVKPMLANRLLKFRFWGNFGELNEEEDICEMEMLYGDKFCFFESEPINDLFACRNFQVMQFTGLKDKNGKEIYEGDILAFENTLNFKTVLQNHFVIKWEDYGNGMVGFTQFSPINKFVVAGNIFENPELLQTTS